MATKTITIDMEAYNRLKRAKRKDESFSQAIKRVVPPQIDFDEWVRKLESNPASEKFIAAVERQVENRRRPSRRR
jgi:predicted CopG family antitoxin